jgi:hypothetical protein
VRPAGAPKSAADNDAVASGCDIRRSDQKCVDFKASTPGVTPEFSKTFNTQQKDGCARDSRYKVVGQCSRDAVKGRCEISPPQIPRADGTMGPAGMSAMVWYFDGTDKAIAAVTEGACKIQGGTWTVP